MTLTPQTPYLDTERLRLEPLRIFHAAEMTRVLADIDLYEFTGGEPPTFEQLTRRYTLMYAGSRNEAEQWHNWILRSKQAGKAVGHVQATVDPFKVELAWTIGSRWQKQGFARESSMAMSRWLVAHGPSRQDAWIHPDHDASSAVARHLGMTNTGVIDEDGEVRWTNDPKAKRYRRGGWATSPSYS